MPGNRRPMKPRIPSGWFKKLVVFICFLVFGAQTHARTEYEIKAAYLYNFIKFVSWSDENTLDKEYLNVCILGKDPFQELIDPIEGKTIQGRAIKLFKAPSYSDDLNCNVVFISSSEQRTVEQLLDKPEFRNALTVSDMDDFAKFGGMIGFVHVGNVIRFEINLSKARQSGVAISSKLLELALEVYQ